MLQFIPESRVLFLPNVPVYSEVWSRPVQLGLAGILFVSFVSKNENISSFLKPNYQQKFTTIAINKKDDFGRGVLSWLVP